MEHEPIPINIGNICGGALIEAFDLKLAEVLANVMDVNTEARAKRVITLKVTIVPKDDRVTLDVQIDPSVNLAPLRPSNSKIFIGKDAEGFLYALNEDPRQMNIFSPPQRQAPPAPIEFKPAAG
ncbi:hypothetical protein SAMN05421819_3538 [Bryocella elongata]|uniref:Uncharacterized protein n=1 Tax=Bryocella elongata TaxID=863522 RepID=A0A1H6B586_9BACT|nr:hypothetical protein [Bryocella elongata]SEG56009.1 hypothetical protein SAMN05421819_3538 [Bryocella elongata]